MNWTNEPTEFVYGWLLREDPDIVAKAHAAARERRFRYFVEGTLYFVGTTGLSEDLLAWALDQVDWKQLEIRLSDVEAVK